MTAIRGRAPHGEDVADDAADAVGRALGLHVTTCVVRLIWKLDLVAPPDVDQRGFYRWPASIAPDGRRAVPRTAQFQPWRSCRSMLGSTRPSTQATPRRWGGRPRGHDLLVLSSARQPPTRECLRRCDPRPPPAPPFHRFTPPPGPPGAKNPRAVGRRAGERVDARAPLLHQPDTLPAALPTPCYGAPTVRVVPRPYLITSCPTPRGPPASRIRRYRAPSPSLQRHHDPHAAGVGPGPRGARVLHPAGGTSLVTNFRPALLVSAPGSRCAFARIWTPFAMPTPADRTGGRAPTRPSPGRTGDGAAAQVSP